MPALTSIQVRRFGPLWLVRTRLLWRSYPMWRRRAVALNSIARPITCPGIPSSASPSTILCVCIFAFSSSLHLLFLSSSFSSSPSSSSVSFIVFAFLLHRPSLPLWLPSLHPRVSPSPDNLRHPGPSSSFCLRLLSHI